MAYGPTSIGGYMALSTTGTTTTSLVFAHV